LVFGLVAWQVASHLSLPIQRAFIPEIIRIGAGSGYFSQFPALRLLLVDACLYRKKRRAQASAHSAAFEFANYGQ
jgi:hypothetical protein